MVQKLSNQNSNFRFNMKFSGRKGLTVTVVSDHVFYVELKSEKGELEK
jgi:hypothetical protein